MSRVLRIAADILFGIGLGLALIGIAALVTGCSAPSVRPAHLDEGMGLGLTWATAAPAVDNYVVEPGEVVSVYDGDTFYIRVPECADVLPALCGKLGVRVDGIDTPERRGKCAAESAAALRARSELVRLLDGGKVVLTHIRREKYGRLLVRVLVEGDDVALHLISQGLARPYSGGARAGWCETKKAP